MRWCGRSTTLLERCTEKIACEPPAPQIAGRLLDGRIDCGLCLAILPVLHVIVGTMRNAPGNRRRAWWLIRGKRQFHAASANDAA